MKVIHKCPKDLIWVVHMWAHTHKQSGFRPLATNTSNSQLLFSCYLSLPPKRVGQLISSEPGAFITQGPITYECGTLSLSLTHTHTLLRHPGERASWGAHGVLLRLQIISMQYLFLYCSTTAPDCTQWWSDLSFWSKSTRIEVNLVC